MAIPEPKPGLVFRYDYLWSREASAGRDSGKERPAYLVAAMEPGTRPRYVVILPITHTPPDKDAVAIEIPANVRRAIGLDDAPGWIVVSEHNVDEWPNAGLAPLPGKPGVFSYGFITPGLFAQVQARLLAMSEGGGGAGVER